MVDLNLWELAYDDTVLQFGTHESAHPFTAQVVVGAPTVDVEDVSHPLSGGLLFGQDFPRGRVIDFAGAHLRKAPDLVGPWWSEPMDDSASFEQAWRAAAVRRTVGRVASCANLDRGRVAYGRPRGYVPSHDRVRHGWLTWQAQFVTVDDRFYSTVEQLVTFGVDPGPAAAFTFPATFPYTGAMPGTGRSWVVNTGTDDTYPVVTFRRGGRPELRLLNNAGGTAWALRIDRNLAYDDVVTVDTRPWARTVTLNGSPAYGLARGVALADAVIPPGTHEVQLDAVDPTGLAEVDVRWRSAYGSL